MNQVLRVPRRLDRAAWGIARYRHNSTRVDWSAREESMYRSAEGGEGPAMYVTPDLSYSVLLLGGRSRAAVRGYKIGLIIYARYIYYYKK